jgi:nickel-dependent lactate racemase
MSRRFALAYGRSEIEVSLPQGCVIVEPPHTPAPTDLDSLIDDALRRPYASDRLEDLSATAKRVLVIVSDTTRPDPRDQMLRHVVARLPEAAELTIAIANGTHGPCNVEALGIGTDLLARARLLNHDAHRDDDIITVGTTARGTPVALHRCVLDTDLVVATGCIKPHYFAGYGAGCKAIFPGLGRNQEIRLNHQLKLEPGARSGVVVGNPCRDDLEEAVALVPVPKFLLNGVLDAQGRVQAVVAGDVRLAFAEGARLCEPFHRVTVRRSSLIVVSDRPPFTSSLYQASKLVAAVAPALSEAGTIVLVAECAGGIEPVDTVNRAIYEIGLRPRLPRDHRIVLVSSVPAELVRRTYCEHADSVEAAIAGHGAALTVFTHAGTALVEVR